MNRMRSRFGAALIAACAALTPLSARSQWIVQNGVTGVARDTGGIVIAMEQGTLRIDVRTASVVRIRYSLTASFPPDTDDVILPVTTPVPRFLVDSVQGGTRITTARLAVTVGRVDGTITFADSGGRKLFEDYGRSLTPADAGGERTLRAEVFSNLWGSSEAFFGLGQHQAGVWNYRGEAVDLSQDNTNIAVPLFLSTNGYGIFWNNASRSRFNNRFLNALYLSAESADIVDYFFIAGPAFDDIIAVYRDLTGRAPLFGRWAYGFWQCKNRYRTSEEVLGVARRYRALHIPVDNIVQDWFWWNTMGEPVFDAARYPD
ncbi:MAG TPA: TIM-barrel domain-containing protein, partial [Bacteroidota bacterium]|nr:TIM-barrel domain-containing protein [Bacteroidota bacterium]